MIFIAPTEPKSTPKALHPIPTKVSLLPERFGLDYAFRSCSKRLCGVQRKEFPSDFVSSLNDGRLAKELAQAQAVIERGGFAMLLLEGQPRFGPDGSLQHRFADFSQDRYYSFITTMQVVYGVGLVIAPSKHDTPKILSGLYHWAQKDSHRSLAIRPKSRPDWGVSSRVEMMSHFLQGLPACGPTRARAVVEHFGGLPLSWTVGEKELAEVKGVGKGMAGKWVEFLERRGVGKSGGGEGS